MSLLAQVAAVLEQRSVPFAVVGAAAMAAYSVARSTLDIDLLTVDSVCLNRQTWESVRQTASIEIRRGDDTDPLLGVVQLIGSRSVGGGAIVDVIVGRSSWQADILRRATPRLIDEVLVPVAAHADVIVLKLFAGGPQDISDIQQLLQTGDREAITQQVKAVLGDLPPDARALWARIVGAR